MATAVYSALTGVPVDNRVALTGEVSIWGLIKPVGGIVPKVAAAARAGARRVFIPRDNYQKLFGEFNDIEVVPVDRLEDAIKGALFHEKGAVGKVVAPAALPFCTKAGLKM
jgi:Lon-like ATP-dependent protease